MDHLIGNTPLYKTRHLPLGESTLSLKLENLNFGGSIKDRIAVAMIEQAEQSGKLRPGMRILEATVGNTGLALAQVANQRGYKTTIIAPDKMSTEKLNHLRAVGAEVIITRTDVPTGHPEHYQSIAKKMAEASDQYYYVDQFNNAANPLVHEQTTAPEIWQQTGGKLDAIILGAGTGGHLTGIGRYFRQVAPQVKIILADPAGSVLAKVVQGEAAVSQPWSIEGVGHDYIPTTCDLSCVDEAIAVSDTEAYAAARLLLRQEGILAGSSTGVVIAAAIAYAQRQSQPQRLVSFVYDTGNKYLSKFYNDQWLTTQGLDVGTLDRMFMDD